MGKADAESKKYLSDPVVFSDLFNYKLYGGKQMILPEMLQEMDPAELEIVGEDEMRIPVQKYRDLMKLWKVFCDENTVYVIFGMESQMDIHYAMPVRDMLYDALNYAGQVECARRKYRNQKNKSERVKLSRGEFLSGFRKEDKLKPVITLVIYLGTKEWDGPLSIYDMLDIQNEELLEFIPNYKINLITPAGIPDEDFGKFRTDIGKVLEYIKYSDDKEKIKQFQGELRFTQMDADSVNLVNAVTESGLSVKADGGKANMCKGIEDLRAEERELGRKEGRAEMCKKLEESTLCNIKNLMISLKLNAGQAMDALMIPVQEQAQYISKL